MTHPTPFVLKAVQDFVAAMQGQPSAFPGIRPLAELAAEHDGIELAGTRGANRVRMLTMSPSLQGIIEGIAMAGVRAGYFAQEAQSPRAILCQRHPLDSGPNLAAVILPNAELPGEGLEPAGRVLWGSRVTLDELGGKLELIWDDLANDPASCWLRLKDLGAGIFRSEEARMFDALHSNPLLADNLPFWAPERSNTLEYPRDAVTVTLTELEALRRQAGADGKPFGFGSGVEVIPGRAEGEGFLVVKGRPVPPVLAEYCLVGQGQDAPRVEVEMFTKNRHLADKGRDVVAFRISGFRYSAFALACPVGVLRYAVGDEGAMQ